MIGVVEPLVDREHINKCNTANQRVKSYEASALEIRKAKHLNRVAKTKFMSKYLDKTSQSPVKTLNYFNLNVSDQTTMTKNKDEFDNQLQN